jgi:hypothetical protein
MNRPWSVVFFSPLICLFLFAISPRIVAALNTSTGISTKTTTDGNGYYIFPQLHLGGPYNVKRNFLGGPGFNYTDMSLFKNFPLGGADSPRILQLRLESYNLFNHPNFAPPDGNLIDGASFGNITSVVEPVADNGEGDPQPGRAVQLAGRFYF